MKILFAKDRVAGHVVIMDAVPRSRRPATGPGSHVKSRGRNCPFCPGRERNTPPQIAARFNGRGWSVRVVPNRFPAVAVTEKNEKKTNGFYSRRSAYGRHEVIVEHPDHRLEIPDFAPAHLRTLVLAYRDRFRALRRDKRITCALLFKNYGPLAGASMEHPHAQLVGLPFVPRRMRDEFVGAARFYARRRRCIWCEVVLPEAARRGLEIARGGGFSLIAPPASRSPFEMTILPLKHHADFTALGDTEAGPFGSMMALALQKLRKEAGDPAFNFLLHTAPFRRGFSGSFHWHLEIIPKTTGSGAFEQGTGFYVNPMSPELAASILRKRRPFDAGTLFAQSPTRDPPRRSRFLMGEARRGRFGSCPVILPARGSCPRR